MRNALLVVLVALVMGWNGPAFSRPASVWDGVYTTTQAERGAVRYRQVCAMCHGQDLEGNGEAPPLTGRFIPDWEGMPLADLFEKIQTTMPLFAPATLKDADTTNILAFILQANDFPAGSSTLEDGEVLKRIRFNAVNPVGAAKPAKSR